MKVFISSVITGYEHFRDAVASASENLGHEVIRAENFGATPGTPQQACLAGLRESDVVVLLVGARYGAPQPSGHSATDEEYREARESKPVLVFVERTSEREPQQESFLTEVQGWVGGHMTQDFRNAEELRGVVIRQLHRMELSQQVGTADPDEMQARATRLLPDDNRASHKDALVVAIAGGPRQSVLRPAMVEDNEVYETLSREALFGQHRIFDARHGTQRVVRDDALVLEQPDASVYLDEEGSLRITVPVRDSSDSSMGGLAVIIHEDVEERLACALGYADWVLEYLDPTHRLTRVAIVAKVIGGGTFGWRTRAEHALSPTSFTMNPWATGGSVGMLPPDRARGALRTNAREIAEDLAIRLRRTQQG